MMTRTAAARKAAAHLRFGWYRASGTSGYVYCPECRRKIEATWLAWETGTKERREALTAHLIAGCDEV